MRAFWCRPSSSPVKRCDCEHLRLRLVPASAILQPVYKLFPILLVPLLSGCVATALVDTAVTAVTLPVKVASRAVDLATTSQSEADEKRGRELRKQDEKRGRETRLMAQRCRRGRPIPGDICTAIPR